MKLRKINIATILPAALLFFSCESFHDADLAKDIQYCSLDIELESPDYSISGEGLTVTVTNIDKGYSIEKETTGKSIHIDSIIPGIHNISISGAIEDQDKKKIFLNGERLKYPLIEDRETLQIEMKGSQLGPVIFKEIFYSGTANFYFRNQFYELYNNSEETVYLDGLFFADLYPTKATLMMPVWPPEDKGNYVYAERVWKFPGTGTEYPLAPGESCVISQFAANHKLPQYNPNSPIDGTSSEFEFNMNNKNYPDQKAPDMVHVFYDGKAEMGGAPQYLTSVFGGAYVIFRPNGDEIYDPVNNKSLQTKDLSKNSSIFAKVPIRYVWDAVEAGDNESMLKAKRVPGVLDAGMTYVGATYNSLGVARKKIGERADGTPLLQDTNNSTNDFDRGVVPQFRRYHSKMPSWNHTLKENK